ncbi:cilia- and flagella-associated protein 251-like isoform X1 [Phyllopteryx taeniolatus]|uniref:cilia- and flagella-associated protein 251-like isoform X1 n=1 Tax=Phyllopteryx taeniolatus TaxID=161469 RepID=UPI002AD41570|nr:cilia- and flagella-associated protein 251-like isoform X1 [Phyllopteryx taeniolatus]
MCKVRNLRTLVKQRLNVAVEEIFELFERTIAEYEEELGRRKEADERRQRRQLDAVLKPANEADVQRALVECQEEEVPSEQQEEPADPSHLKEEEEEEEEDVWSSQDGEQLQGLEEVADVNSLPWTGVRVKSEDDDGGVTQRVLAGCQEEQEPQPGLVKEENTWSSRDGERLQSPEEAEMITFTLTGVRMKSEEDEGQPSQLHHRQSGEKPSQHATTEADGQHCEDLLSQPDNFAPLSDVMMMMTSHSSDTDHTDDTREPSETNEKSKGMASKGAEIARRYRERRDADPDRRRRYLEKERNKWKKHRETGKKKSVHELSEIEKWALRKKWREAKSQARARNRASALLQSETPSNFPADAAFPPKPLEPGPSWLDHWKFA